MFEPISQSKIKKIRIIVEEEGGKISEIRNEDSKGIVLCATDIKKEGGKVEGISVVLGEKNDAMFSLGLLMRTAMKKHGAEPVLKILAYILEKDFGGIVIDKTISMEKDKLVKKHISKEGSN